MLVVSRRPGERINVGDDISFTILEINGKQVRVGINAPKEVPIHREEVYRRIHESENHN